MSTGYIYILFNPSYPKLIKLGKTRNSPFLRAQQLSADTGVPTSFIVIWASLVSNCDDAESESHHLLAAYRVNDGREFFAVPVEIAISFAQKIAVKYAANEHDALQLHSTQFLNTDPDSIDETASGDEAENVGKEWGDQLVPHAIEVLKVTKRASTSMIQRRLKIGYNRASRILEILEGEGIVGPENGSSPREILKDLDNL